MARIEFFYDVVSPYSYLALARLPAWREQTGATVVLRACFLGGLMKAVGNRPPATVPLKGRWMLQDLTAQAERLGVPFRMNPGFPFRTLAAMRLLVTAETSAPQHVEALARALFDVAWAQGGDPDSPESLAAAVAQAGADPALVDAAQDPEAKAALQRATEEAAERGAFGAPTFFWGERMYWGHDRLDLLAWHLSR
jgi:2-hydroxychromene-2-carboxylate isomerase